MALAAPVLAGRLDSGTLMVDGKPFYPLGSWNSAYTTPEDIARLGMNTSFRMGPGTPEAVRELRPFIHRCAELGVQVVPYISWGREGQTQHSQDATVAASRLADEPNLLAWYIGDDVGRQHLDGIRRTTEILRERTPGLATVADYIAEQTPEAKTTFTQFVDVRCQYTYLLPTDSLSTYRRFFDQQREFVGDPLWTWIQTFMRGSVANTLGLGVHDSPGPVPDPEQVRLLAFTAIGRGVRGLLFFPHFELHVQPELAAEVALICREVRLVESHLAAGAPTFDLAVSDPDVDATAFRYGGSTVVSAMIARGHYHRWVDEAIVRNVTIDVLWAEPSLPRAVLLATPDFVECAVAEGADGTARVTLPSLELAGLVLVSNDETEIARLREGMGAVAAQLAPLAVPGAAAQVRTALGAAWQAGFAHLDRHHEQFMPAMRALERCGDALADDRDADAVREWRTALRGARAVVDSMMRFADARRESIPADRRMYLMSPHGIRSLRNLASAPAPDEPWHYVREWMVTGPFALYDGPIRREDVPDGMLRAYPPESDLSLGARFATLDGPAGWMYTRGDMSALLDLVRLFATTRNVLAYARCTVIAPKETDVEMSLGSNDGAKVWVNGDEVFFWSGGRRAFPHEDRIPVHLNAGRNALMVKVENLGMNWGLYLAFDDPDRRLQFDTGE